MKIIIIPGSIGTKSYNRKLATFMQKRYQKLFDIEILDIENIPMFNVDIELNPPEIIIEYRKKIIESDGIIFATPEYNHSIPGVLKNTLDWFSRVKRVMSGKPVMIVGASTGFLGTARAQSHLRQILNSGGISAITLPGNEVFIGNAKEKFDENGSLIHQPTIEFLDTVIQNFIQWANKINNS
jgi:NAD(P)H-dependent FMN reductase